jgi:hypothetical protein
MNKQEAIEVLEPLKWSPDKIGTAFDSADNFLGEHAQGYIIMAQHRDSDSLSRSNWQVAMKMFPDAEVVRYGHWLVGWTEQLVLPLDAPDDVLIKAAQMREDLDDYPVLDDDHWSTLEYEEACDYWDSLSMCERIELCAHHRVSIFAARRDELPETPTGELCTYN